MSVCVGRGGGGREERRREERSGWLLVVVGWWEVVMVEGGGGWDGTSETKRDTTVSTERGDGSSERKGEIRDDELMGMDRETFPQNGSRRGKLHWAIKLATWKTSCWKCNTPPTGRAKHCFLQVAARHGFELKKASLRTHWEPHEAKPRDCTKLVTKEWVELVCAE